jgi:adenine C2-methylase RlmN of 23S rRNA A2503 and tRNA A37
MPTLEITTLIGCPMRCTFCPQDKLAANYPAEAVRALVAR